MVCILETEMWEDVYGVRCRSTTAGAGGMLRRLNPIKCPDELPHNGTGLNE